MRWNGSGTDALKGHFRQPSVRLGGVTTAWMPLDEVSFSAKEARLVPGVPGRIEVRGPALEVVVAQADLDPWQERFDLPFRLRLGERGLVTRAGIAGVRLGEIETRLEIVRGWFVLRPRRAALLGVPQWVSLFRSYLPVPPLSSQARLDAIEHEKGRLRLRIAVEDFDEELSPGIVDRLRERLVPFGR